ncbi:MAG: hypothetical protein IPK58_09930 [Acidobacteria bacterium]|nr:hypothetical protein [Acidobacteriota bacterium]
MHVTVYTIKKHGRISRLFAFNANVPTKFVRRFDNYLAGRRQYTFHETVFVTIIGFGVQSERMSESFDNRRLSVSPRSDQTVQRRRKKNLAIVQGTALKTNSVNYNGITPIGKFFANPALMIKQRELYSFKDSSPSLM